MSDFIQLPKDLQNSVLRLNDKGVIVSEKKGIWTWIKTLIYKNQYNLSAINQHVLNILENKKDPLNEQEVRFCLFLSLKIEKYNYKNKKQGKRIDDAANRVLLNKTPLYKNELLIDLLVSEDEPQISNSYLKELKDNKGVTPLMTACMYNRTDLIHFLIRLGFNTEAKDKDGRTALIWASMHGQIEVIRCLKELGADLEARDKDGRTALMTASILNKTESIRCLKELGADLEARDKHGITALIKASMLGKIESIRFLKELGANLEARDKHGRTALIWASIHGKTESIRCLKDLGADLKARDENDMTALMTASMLGEIESIRCLKELGADLEARGENGMTALMTAWAASLFQETKSVECLKKLGADLEARDLRGNTLLMRGAMISLILKELVANLKTQNSKGMKALKMALKTNWIEEINKLLKLGAKLDLEGEDSALIKFVIYYLFHENLLDESLKNLLTDSQKLELQAFSRSSIDSFFTEL